MELGITYIYTQNTSILKQNTQKEYTKTYVYHSSQKHFTMHTSYTVLYLQITPTLLCVIFLKSYHLQDTLDVSRENDTLISLYCIKDSRDTAIGQHLLPNISGICAKLKCINNTTKFSKSKKKKKKLYFNM
jgi:cell division protein FtsL